MILTRCQRIALFRVYTRNGISISYLAFRRTVQYATDFIVVKVGVYWLGIEPDGYTHS